MNLQQATGVFGKLPAHGDFIHRNLSSKVINNLDSWLQAFVGSTQERLGASWLDIYLTSPIWRFCFSSGVVDDHVWAGILLPSVDRVGRYFPLMMVRKLGVSIAPTQFICSQDAWYNNLESAALQALDGQVPIDRLLELANASQPLPNQTHTKQRALTVESGVMVDLAFENADPTCSLPYFLDAFVSSQFASYSAWATAGSERVAPCSFISPSLPPTSGSAAMLDGLWEHWQWSVPVQLQSPAQPQKKAEPPPNTPNEAEDELEDDCDTQPFLKKTKNSNPFLEDDLPDDF